MWQVGRESVRDRRIPTEASAARRPIIRALDVLREREERQELELGRTHMASKGGATQSQREASQDEGYVAPVTEALAWDSPERPKKRKT